MTITKEDVKNIAKLAKLRFSDEEAEKFAVEFEHILKYFETLDKLDIHDVKPIKPHVSVVRKDIAKKCEIDNLYENTKSMRETYVEVPKIID